MWEDIATRLEGRVVVLEPLSAGHEERLFAAARDMDWSWMPVDPSHDRAAFTG
jgi:hypothetical protein